jgi:phospholipid/cholesterol/gamma-HCH transport system permease protein
MNILLQHADNLGKLTFETVQSFTTLFRFIYLSLRCTFTLPRQAKKTILYNTISQIYFSGHMSLPLITFIALATGGIVILQSVQLSSLSSPEMMGNILVVTVVRELGPLLTSLIIIARSGTAIASEVGSMQVNKEIDALRVLSIEPLSYVVFPRLLGGIISLICLAFYFNVIALIGGFFVVSFVSDLAFSFYLQVLAQTIDAQDISVNLIKNTFGGLIIFSIAIDQGFRVVNSYEIPIAATRAVVKSMMAVMIFNLIITIISISGVS